MLYLGSQVENFRFFDESPKNLPGNEIEDINKINKILKENFLINNFNTNQQGADQNSALLSSDNSNSCEGNATSYVTVSTTFQGPPKETNTSGEAVQKSAQFSISNDLMTDDEKENNLSY
jgi:hypothetical protein